MLSKGNGAIGLADLRPLIVRASPSLSQVRKSARAPHKFGKADFSIASSTDIVMAASHVKCNAVAPPINVQYGFGA